MASSAVRCILLTLLLCSCRFSACQDTTSSPKSESGGDKDAGSIATTGGITLLTGTRPAPAPVTSTPTYASFSSTRTLVSITSTSSPSSVAAANGTDDVSTVTYLMGSSATTATLRGNFSQTSASTAPTATNTQPCNNHVEFCERQYSNVTVVGTHNSMFVTAGSAAANQQLSVEDQLNDGVRFLQGQMHWPVNATGAPHFCHTSCDILDAGPITDWLGRVAAWVAVHPFDVVTVLLENGNYSTPDRYAPYIESTGLLQYAYVPPKVPMARRDWPTLADMILHGRRLVLLLDYMANQTAYPWWLDEFSYMWETPFDPADRAFPCTVQRPPNLAPADAGQRLYLVNHNLNVEVSLLGASVLVPAVSVLNTTNNASGYGSLGLAANNCRAAWDGTPPTVLNVDYYNIGGFPGSVFEVAAQMNNVTYSRPCCGLVASVGATLNRLAGSLPWAAVVWTALWLLL